MSTRGVKNEEGEGMRKEQEKEKGRERNRRLIGRGRRRRSRVGREKRHALGSKRLELALVEELIA